MVVPSDLCPRNWRFGGQRWLDSVVCPRNCRFGGQTVLEIVRWPGNCPDCQHEDIWDKLNDHEQRIEQLEKLCLELNSNLEALQTILAAVQENDYVTEVIKVVENGVEVGYSLTFAKGGTVTIYHGKDGAGGAENSAPKVGVKKAADCAYYWTSGDEWLTSEDGDMIPATVHDLNGRGRLLCQCKV